MACLNRLKEDIRSLSAAFPSSHPRFRTITATLDEVAIVFVPDTGPSIPINANLLETYPETPPLWFSDSELPGVSETLAALSETEGAENLLLSQIRLLITRLCSLFHVPPPSELAQLGGGGVGGSGAEMEEVSEETPEDEEAEGSGGDEDLYEMEEGLESRGSGEGGESGAGAELNREGKEMLERLRRVQREQHLQGAVQGSIGATDRLMKELKDIYRSDHFKKGSYKVELCNDSLYDWRVELRMVDADSGLAGDLAELKKRSGQDHILLQFLFKDNFPFEPPFVRVVSPTLSNGFVLGGGAICMEVLTKQGWSSAYSLESLILQIAATLVKGKARIQLDAPSHYSLAKAQQSFKSLVQIHEKSGWYTPPKQDG